jgi:hypothetical protein
MQAEAAQRLAVEYAELPADLVHRVVAECFAPVLDLTDDKADATIRAVGLAMARLDSYRR